MKKSGRELAIGLIVVCSVALTSTGCKKKDDSSTSKETSSASRPSGRKGPGPGKTAADWSNKPLKPVADKVDGVGFTVDLPDGLKREEKKSDGTFPGYVTWNAKGNPFIAPGFTVQIDAMPPPNLESAARSGMALNPKLVVSRKEPIPTGFLVTHHEKSKKFISVKAWRKTSSGKFLRISVTQRNSNPIPNFEAQRGWMEKVAKSMKPK
jgi:hypothetical protein